MKKKKKMDDLIRASKLVLKGYRTPEETVLVVLEFPGFPPLFLTSSPCFKTLRINVCYWREKVPGSYGLSQAFPCFLGLGFSLAPHHIYGLPSREYPGLMKVSERLREG